eukprot:m.225152 g.225152  ORF g.225152 m.225152 type:complete len:122 (+) comp16627_c0_seq1:513-878(+)
MEERQTRDIVEFCQLHVRSVDQRTELKYVEQSTLLWNGTMAQGGEQILGFYGRMPSSRHKLEGVDAQPGRFEGEPCYVGIVRGTVSYGDCPPKSFVSTLIFGPAAVPMEQWRILNESFRFL